MPKICMKAMPKPTPIKIEVLPENLSCSLVMQPSWVKILFKVFCRFSNNSKYLIIAIHEQRRSVQAVISLHINQMRTAAAGRDGSVVVVIPVLGPVHSTALQVHLHSVPGHHVFGVATVHRLFQLLVQHHFQVGFKDASGDSDGQLHNEDN